MASVETHPLSAAMRMTWVIDRRHQLLGGYGSVLGSAIGVFIPATLQNGFVIVGIQPWEQHRAC